MAPDADFLLAVEGLTVSFDGFRAVDDLSLYINRNDPSHHRTERRWQDHAARLDLRPHPRQQRLDHLQRERDHPHEGIPP